MGTQQLLLIVVGTVLIGIMIAVGLFMFRDQSANTNRDSISNDLVHCASKAQLYKRKPQAQGGGGGSFVGFRLETVFADLRNANATYSLGTVSQDVMSIIGVGNEIGYDNATRVKVVIDVTADSTSVNEVN
ncbi:MAG: hypothetical protein HY708_03410 [Ignavibacteriae bacterium]|nr:hypothetical protein [Ignavibacteriota bacterium]